MVAILKRIIRRLDKHEKEPNEGLTGKGNKKKKRERETQIKLSKDADTRIIGFKYGWLVGWFEGFMAYQPL